MSFILDALRKSEAERQQGRTPDLGASLQMIHRTPKPRLSAFFWVLLLLLNGLGLAGLYWYLGLPQPVPLAEKTTPSLTAPLPTATPTHAAAQDSAAQAATQAPATQPQQAVIPQPQPQPVAEAQAAVSIPQAASSAGTFSDSPIHGTLIRPAQATDEDAYVWAEAIDPDAPAAPMPGVSVTPAPDATVVAPPAASAMRLEDMPLSFQRQVPTLRFNSHIFSSNPASRRIMINDIYLREGDQVAGMRIERITDAGVILTLRDVTFAMSVLHDWMQPR